MRYGLVEGYLTPFVHPAYTLHPSDDGVFHGFASAEGDQGDGWQGWFLSARGPAGIELSDPFCCLSFGTDHQPVHPFLPGAFPARSALRSPVHKPGGHRCHSYHRK